MESITPPCHHNPRNMLPRQLLAELWKANTDDASRKVNTKEIQNHDEAIIAIIPEQVPRVDSPVGSQTDLHVTSACSEKVAAQPIAQCNLEALHQHIRLVLLVTRRLILLSRLCFLVICGLSPPLTVPHNRGSHLKRADLFARILRLHVRIAG